MTKVVDVTFDKAITKRLANVSSESSPPSVTNAGVTIAEHETFLGDGSGNFDGASYFTLSSDSRFDFGSTFKRAWRIPFFVITPHESGLLDCRVDANNRWFIKYDTQGRLTGNPDKLIFFVRVGGTTVVNFTQNMSFNITLGRWHTLEAVFDGYTYRFYVDGYFIVKVTDGTNTPVNVAAGVTVGRVNDSTTGTPTYKYFTGLIDKLEFYNLTAYPEDNIVITETSYPGRANESTIYWTGNVSQQHKFSSEITVKPAINGNTFPNNLPDFEVVNNGCYIAGIEPNKKVKSDNTVVDIGLTKPSTVTLSTTGTGLTGTYDYVITAVDSDSNESGPSPISGSITPSNNAIRITLPSPPTGAATYNIYRRKTSANQAQHYFVTSRPAAAGTYDDNNSDSSVSLLKIAPRQTVNKPPAANFVTYHDGRMYYLFTKIDSTEYPTRAYFSEVNQLEIVDSNYWYYVGDNDSEYITGAYSYNGALIIFKEQSFYEAYGDPRSAEFDIQSKPIGCVAHQTIQEINGLLIWLADEGVYIYNGSGFPVLVSKPVGDIFTRMPKNRRAYATATVDVDNGLYLLSISYKSETSNDIILCYHHNESSAEYQRWTIWDVSVTTLFKGAYGSGRQLKPLFGDADSKVGYFERGALDLLTGISWRWRSKGVNFAMPGQKIRAHYVTAVLNTEGEIDKIVKLGVYNNGTENLVQRLISGKQITLKERIAQRANFLAPVFEVIDARESIRLLSLSLDITGASRR